MSDYDTNKNTTNEKPITLSPLSFKDALVALLKTRPEPKEKKKLKKTKEKTG